MGQRARARIDFEAERMVQSRQAAIDTDGTPVFIWRRTSGSLPCSCTSGADHRFDTATQTPVGTNNLEGVVERPAAGNQPRYTDDSGLDDDYVGDDEPQQNPYDLGIRASSFGEVSTPDTRSNANAVPTAKDSGWLNAVVEQGPFRTGQETQCPVCFGTSYTDAWKPFKGARILGDFARFSQPDVEGGDLDRTAHPAVCQLADGGTVQWTLAVPKWFYRCVRVLVWNGREAQDCLVEYQADDQSWVTASPGRVDKLQGSGRGRAFRVTANGAPLKFTHLEIIYLLVEPILAAVPRLQIPFDQEFVDYNVTCDIELPVDTGFQDGDVVADAKYGRCWQASTVDTVTTAGGRVLSITPSLRSINSTEILWAMNIWRSPQVGVNQLPIAQQFK